MDIHATAVTSLTPVVDAVNLAPGKERIVDRQAGRIRGDRAEPDRRFAAQSLAHATLDRYAAAAITADEITAWLTDLERRRLGYREGPAGLPRPPHRPSHRLGPRES